MAAAGPNQAVHALIIALDNEVPAQMPGTEVLVVAPALNPGLRRWFSDEDRARRDAKERAASSVQHLKRHGVHAEGRVGDPDPLLAIADALATFPADEIVIAARPERSSTLVDDLVARAHARFALPVSRTGRLPRAA